MRSRGSRTIALVAALLTVILWGGIMAMPSVVAATNLTYMGYTLIDPGTLGGSITKIYGFNNKGEMVGTSTLAGDSEARPFLYSNGTMTDLGSLGGLDGAGFAINDSGEVLGTSSTVGAHMHYSAFLYSNGTMTGLSGPDGGDSDPVAINGNGQVIVTVNFPPPLTHTPSSTATGQ